MPHAIAVQPVDASVGAKIRLRRQMMGMSQTQLADQLGVSFQQVQKYEKGTNRVSASRLHMIAAALDQSISDLFAIREPNAEVDESAGSQVSNALIEFLSTAEGLRLNRAFVQVTDLKVRRRLIALVRAIGADDPSDIAPD